MQETLKRHRSDIPLWRRSLLEESVLNPGLVIQPTSVTTNARHCFPGLCSVSHSVMSREVFMGRWMLPKCLEPPLNVFSSGFTGHSSCSPSLTTLDRLWVDMVSETAGALPGLSSSRARAASFSRRPGVGGDQVQGSPPPLFLVPHQHRREHAGCSFHLCAHTDSCT